MDKQLKKALKKDCKNMKKHPIRFIISILLLPITLPLLLIVILTRIVFGIHNFFKFTWELRHHIIVNCMFSLYHWRIFR